MYEASKLNVVKKTRSNQFTWRGQFTPELIEYFLDVHSEPDFLIADPFSGSGTVLFESLRKNLDVVGLEVNPSAYAMSKFFELAMLTFPERWNLCQELLRNIPLSGLQVNRPLYQKLEKTNYRESYENLINFARKAIDVHTNKIQLVLILNILFKMEGYRKLNICQALYHPKKQDIFQIILIPNNYAAWRFINSLGWPCCR